MHRRPLAEQSNELIRGLTYWLVAAQKGHQALRAYKLALLTQRAGSSVKLSATPQLRGRIVAIVAYFVVLSGVSTSCGFAQQTLEAALSQPLSGPESITEQHRRFVQSRLVPLKPAGSAMEWQRHAERLRAQVLDNVVFRGVPAEWREGKPDVVWHDVIETDHGYRIRKLRFEALPDLWIPALLYEPHELKDAAESENIVPAVLNVNGHAATGKSTAYKQLRCINLAKRGMLALNLEWIGMGQLRTAGFKHNHLSRLDLCGRSGLSVFYLAMSRGLDVLLDHPHADLKRTAVTGLSGGGWQTIMLSSLDTRVQLAVPVAGHSAIEQRLEHVGSIGDLEQIPNDLAKTAGYVHLTALMTPRPMLMIYNTKDNCCFVADTVKPNTFDPVVPFYEQAGAADKLEYYANSEPGTHNYDQDNREQLYRFLDHHFFPFEKRGHSEFPSLDEVLTHKELNVPLPDETADFHTLAAEAARGLPKPLPETTDQQRALLRTILRYSDPEIGAARFTGPQPAGAFTVRQLRLKIGGWEIPAAVIEDDAAIKGNIVRKHVILLADGGYASQQARIEELVLDGCRVLAIDPVLFGHSTPELRAKFQNAMLLATVGERPLGIQAAQVVAAARFFARVFVADAVRIEANGATTSLIARCAAAVAGPKVISSVKTNGEAHSLHDFLKPGPSYGGTPEVYCFGLLEYFDIKELIELANRN
ncbi:MAG: hypothetical protein H8E66_20540 [Planctomycetes bacterium]|nr:hypothetical protein [Planctomycetota bacterium]